MGINIMSREYIIIMSCLGGYPEAFQLYRYFINNNATW